MKLAIISDIHQSTHWKKIIPRANEFDKIIFLGDYFDCFKNKWPHQMNNFLDIIKFKKNNIEKVDLLWGNHETSYLLDERCSGYQHDHCFDIEEILKKNKDQFEIVSIYDNWIFAHGGISEIWMKCAGIKDINEINQLFKEKPNYFRHVGPDAYGDNPNEGPLWIRPFSLLINAIPEYNQCVGHTEHKEPMIKQTQSSIIVFSDTREHNYLTIIDTEHKGIKFEVLVPRK